MATQSNLEELREIQRKAEAERSRYLKAPLPSNGGSRSDRR